MDLNLNNLILVLNATGSFSDPDTLTNGESQLSQWSDQPGFHSMLQTIYLDRSFDIQLRWLAIIYLKNSISTHWRRSCRHAVSNEEKYLIRSRAFQLMDEPNRRLTLQNASAIAKISRIDFPREWPDLFEQFNIAVLSGSYENSAHSPDQLLSLYNGLEVLNQILKSLSTAKHVLKLSELRTRPIPLISKVAQIYFSAVNQWMNNFDLATMEVGYKALKVTSRLIYDCLENPSRNEDAVKFFVAMKDHLTGFIELFVSNPSELLGKHIKHICKFLVRLKASSPAAFMLMPVSIELFHVFFHMIECSAEILSRRKDPSEEEDDEQERNNIISRVVITGFNLLADQVQLVLRRGSTLKRASATDREEATQCMKLIEQDLFTPNVTGKLAKIIIFNYLRISPAEEKNRRENPEESYNDEQGSERWKFEVHPAAERLMTFMISTFRYILDYSVSFIHETLNQTDDPGLQDCGLQILQYDSTGVLSEIDLDDMIIQLLPLKNSDSVLLRRRFCLVISEWTILDFLDREIKFELYSVIINDYLSKSATDDCSVMLAAVGALKSLLDDFECCTDALRPLVNDAFIRLLTLINRLQTVECKVAVLDVFGLLVDTFGPQSAYHLDTIMKLLPSVWQDAGDRYSIKETILETVEKIAYVAERLPSTAYDIVIPLIVESCDPKNPESEYLLKDGLLLWDQAINACDTRDAGNLLGLLDILLSLIKDPSELIQYKLSIINSYIVWSIELDSTQLSVPDLAAQLFNVFNSYLENVNSEVSIRIVMILEYLALRLPLNEYIQSLADSKLMNILISLVLASKPGPQVSLNIWVFFSRMAISNAELFCSLIDTNIDDILDHWLEAYHTIGDPKKCRLSCFGLTAIFALHHPSALNKFDSFCGVWLHFLSVGKLLKAEDFLGSDDDDYGYSLYGVRIKKLKETDPALTISFVMGLKTALQSVLVQPKGSQLIEQLTDEGRQAMEKFISVCEKIDMKNNQT